MSKLINSIDTFDRIILKILKYITIAAFIGLTIILTAGIFVRYFGVFLQKIFPATSFSLHWSDEIVELLFAYLVFFGSAALWITKGHFSAGDRISRFINSQRIKNFYRLIIEVIVLTFTILFLYYSYFLFSHTYDISNALALPKKIWHVCMPISGLIMVFYSIKNVIIELIGVIKPEAVKEILEKKIS
jgi:TRAP-type transport system small permease protein